MLHTEGDTDDGDAEDYPEKEMGQEYPYSPYEEPDDIHEEGKTTATLRDVYHLAAEGQRASTPSFRVCIPKGIPMIVINKPILDTKYSSAMKKPPNRTQMIFPRIFMCYRVL